MQRTIYVIRDDFDVLLILFQLSLTRSLTIRHWNGLMFTLSMMIQRSGLN